MNTASSVSFKDTKNHYLILDGLRGVAAVLVVMFHILETFSGGDHVKQLINHGYLAVDFFFVLSGFVIGYAYDDRWSTMGLKEFFKRRLIRLHPMILVGMVIGAVTFYFQDSPMFPAIHEVTVPAMLLIMLIGFTLIPVPPSMDIRGWQEMHPLNGPAWTLFFEYIANIFYGLFLHKFSNRLLAVLAFVAGAMLIHMALTNGQGDIIGGWSLTPKQLWIGFSRLMYPFLAGLLLSRIVKPGNINRAFLWSSLLLITVLSIPRLGGHELLWVNGLYDSLCVIVIFPIIVYLGASGTVSGASAKVSKFLGDISYPIYIIHYPFMYMFMAWVTRNNIEINSSKTVVMSVLLLIVTILLAYACVKWYDMPVRKWLMKRFMFTSPAE